MKRGSCLYFIEKEKKNLQSAQSGILRFKRLLTINGKGVPMLVNHIQVAYVLQITPLEAKFMLAPHIERIREMVIPGKKSLDECARLVRKTDVVESLLLNIRFRHPSPELDGKGRIAYTIEKLKEAPLNLKKKIADDPGCLKSGKISGKFRALNSILEEESIKEIKEILRLRGGHIGRKDTAMSQKKRRRVS